MHSEWEIDTRHGGFESVADAALWANGFGDDAIEELRLENEQLALIGVQGRWVAVSGAITVWKSSQNDLDVPPDILFERVEYSVADLSALGLDGGFEARRYRVVDDDSREDVPARVTIRRSRVLLLVDTARARDVEVASA